MNRKLCLQLHFEVKIDEPALIEDQDEEAQDYYRRQKRLYDAVVANPDALNNYQVYLLTTVLECMDWKEWHKLLLGNPRADTESILMPVIATMGEEDQQWFAEATQEGVFYECTEHSMDMCGVSLDSVNIIEEVGHE